TYTHACMHPHKHTHTHIHTCMHPRHTHTHTHTLTHTGAGREDGWMVTSICTSHPNPSSLLSLALLRSLSVTPAGSSTCVKKNKAVTQLPPIHLLPPVDFPAWKLLRAGGFWRKCVCVRSEERRVGR